VKIKEWKERVARDLLENERSYSKALERIVKEYLIPCREKNLLKETTIKTVFFKIESILGASQVVLELLEKRVGKQWQFYQVLGDIFAKFVRFFYFFINLFPLGSIFSNVYYLL
jgi:hypothetical protein